MIAESEWIVVGKLTEDPVRRCGARNGYAYGIRRLRVEKTLKGDPEGLPDEIPLCGADGYEKPGIVIAPDRKYTFFSEYPKESAIYLLRELDSEKARTGWFLAKHFPGNPFAAKPQAPIAPMGQEEARACVRSLGSDRFEEREAAQKRLSEEGAEHWKLLDAAARETPSLEVKRRLEELLGAFQWDREVGKRLWILIGLYPGCVFPATEERIRDIEKEVLDERRAKVPGVTGK